MELKSLEIKQFKKDIYKYYKEMFPAKERKPYRILKKSYNKGITTILGIKEKDKFVGFMIINKIKDNQYLQLDYFSIFKEYQSKGYGKKSIKKLKEKYNSYNGIFIEIEKLGLGKNEEENIQRERRAKFYEQLGFIKLHNDVELYKVIYSLYVLFCTNIKEENGKIIDDIFKIYNQIFGEKRINKNCKLLLD